VSPVASLRDLIRSSLLLPVALLAACAAPGPAPAPASPVTLRVLSYNIHHGQGNDGVFDLERIASLIAALQPDLVALQEVDQGTGRASGVFQADELARLTGMEGRFGRAIHYDGGEYGEAALCRLPILDTAALPLPAAPGHELRCALTLRVEAGGQELLFVATHLDHARDPGDRVAQMEAILAALEAEPDTPVLLLGDLNCQPGSPPLALLGPEWLDAPLAAGAAAPTFPAVDPEVRIDHVLARPADRWRVRQSVVVDEEVVSDHRPLLVVLELLPGGP